METRAILATSVACLLAVAIPVIAGAQDAPAGTVSVGYAVLDSKDGSDTFGVGWTASVSRALTRSVGIVGEVGGAYRTFGAVQGFGAESRMKLHSFLGGARFGGPGNKRVRTFAQVLAGGVNLSSGVSSCGSISTEFCAVIKGAHVSLTYFTLQPGGGVDVSVTRRTAIRLQGDYRAIFPRYRVGGPTVLHTFRLSAGVALAVGRK